MQKVLYSVSILAIWLDLSAQAPQIELELVNQWWVQPVVHPIDIQPADEGRVFVAEQEGIIQLVSPPTGTVKAIPFLNISMQIGAVQGGTEVGLLGLAFHPNYPSNGWFFVNYTDVGGTTYIKRFTRSSTNPELADPNSGVTVLSFQQPYLNHNGGCLRFGPDGYLYIPTGDGGFINEDDADPQNRAQDPGTLFGKVLRINVDSLPYSIPPDNPFTGVPGYLPEIWAIGLRNPWRVEFDPANGDLWIGDVGNDQFEEVDYVKSGTPSGKNFGWRCREGTAPYNTVNCHDSAFYTPPVFEYGNLGGFCGAALVGGRVYRGNQYPALRGWYICCDFCTGQFYGLYPDSEGGFIESSLGKFDPTYNYCAFGVDQYGELYVAGYIYQAIYRLKDKCKFHTAPKPMIVLQDSSTLGCSVSLGYQWYKNGLALAGATSQLYHPTVSGYYQVYTADSTGCPTASDSFWVQPPVNTTREPVGRKTVISPNPSATGQISIATTGSALATVRLFNTEGRLMEINSIVRHTSQHLEIAVGSVPQGCYNIRLEYMDGHCEWAKWVKL
jgi:glucose/arabinose dehydrogenase